MNPATEAGEGDAPAGRVVVVTGAARGLGRCCAQTLAEPEDRVALLDLDHEQASATAAELDRAGGASFAPFACDVRSAGDVERAFGQILERYGRIDVLVNNAGLGDTDPTTELSEQGWDLVVDTCLKGTFLCSQRAGRAMIAAGGGVIVNVASMLGITRFPNRPAYCSAKAGVIALTMVTANEWACHGIRVNAVAPGYLETEAVEEGIESGAFDPRLIASRTPLARLGSPAEAAAAVRYLASADASFVTGHTLVVDGGYTSYGAWWPAGARS